MRKIGKKKTILFTMLVGVLLGLGLTGCDEADVASQNLSKEADNFKIARRIVFINGITDKYLLSIEGFCSITDKSGGEQGQNQLAVTCKDKKGKYKKHFLGLSDNVTYLVEQLDGANVSGKHYKVIFRPSTLLPDFDVR